jgi:hypothetical protein
LESLLVGRHARLTRRQHPFAITLGLQPILGRLSHGDTLQPHLIVGDHRLFGGGAGLQVHDGAGVRRCVDRGLEILQPLKALSASVGHALAQGKIARRALSRRLDIGAKRIVGLSCVETVRGPDGVCLGADRAKRREVTLGRGCEG